MGNLESWFDHSLGIGKSSIDQFLFFLFQLHLLFYWKFSIFLNANCIFIHCYIIILKVARSWAVRGANMIIYIFVHCNHSE